ncbi:UNVERIFIED_CONTAM: Retrovirus-related Pol polyprotein from transposon RE2 [Sesamum radiatum]|uniref:Retrovirus-related Pol polyprotein from transposon RE2 n=1 Tax=Sesamum radiatum TaxID=300843 RepID=A0AAW2JKN0_SESRA
MTINNKLSPKSEDVLYVKDHRRKDVNSKFLSSDKNQFRTEDQSKKPSKSCYRCEKLGHLKRDCRLKLVCDRCGKSGHIKANYQVKMQETEANVAHDRNDSQQPTWEACLSIEVLDQPMSVTSIVHQDHVPSNIRASINYSEEWIVDSGCSHHATGNDDLLSGIRPHREKKVIVTTDNSLHPVMKEGDLNDGDSRRYVLFGPHDVRILSNVKHIAADILFCGKRKESLYVLFASDEYIKKTGKNESSTLWHARLGHVGFQLLQNISTNNLLDGVPNFKNIQQGEICPGCQQGKSHLLFSYSRNKASAALQLVHSDLLGPMRILSYTGLTYVMVIVDDFSRSS